MGNTAARHDESIAQTREEVNALASAFARARSEKERRKLQERRDVATQTLYALMSAYNALTVSRTYRVRVCLT